MTQTIPGAESKVWCHNANHYGDTENLSYDGFYCFVKSSPGPTERSEQLSIELCYILKRIVSALEWQRLWVLFPLSNCLWIFFYKGKILRIKTKQHPSCYSSCFGKPYLVFSGWDRAGLHLTVPARVVQWSTFQPWRTRWPIRPLEDHTWYHPPGALVIGTTV